MYLGIVANKNAMSTRNTQRSVCVCVCVLSAFNTIRDSLIKHVAFFVRCIYEEEKSELCYIVH